MAVLSMFYGIIVSMYYFVRRQGRVAMARISRSTLTDTFPEFLHFWAESQSLSIERQVEAWATNYLAPYPELLQKQVADYASQGIDWRRVAAERVFPYVPARLRPMQQARANILDLAQDVWTEVQKALSFRLSVHFLVHVGIGCGAGWATTYGNLPAVLLGLENIAEEDWCDPDSIRALLSHELAHLFHDHLRTEHSKPTATGPYWQLYSEGFACLCEETICSSRPRYRARRSFVADEERPEPSASARLAHLFIATAEANDPVSPFFGSWLEVEGVSEAGYILGHQILTKLRRQADLRALALLDDVDGTMRHELTAIANLGA